MKVDLQILGSAYLKLRELEQRLEEIDRQIYQTGRYLAQCGVGGRASTDRISDSLNCRIAELKRYGHSTAELGYILKMAVEEYNSCEKRNQMQVSGNAVIWYTKSYKDQLDELPVVLPLKEKEIIDQYIMPLITIGR